MENLDYSPRLNQLDTLLKLKNEPSYRFKQILANIYKNGVQSFQGMTDLPKDLRDYLDQDLGQIQTLARLSEEKDAFTTKVLFETKDGFKIESVLLTYKTHTTLCVSSQSGCALGCKFCATGHIGFNKNLDADEIADQLLYFIQQKIQVNNVVFMGMGEPFANPHFFDALKLLTNKETFNMGQRKISISTVGLIPGIEKLTNEFPQVNLAYSLHFPTNEQRGSYMPVSKAYPVEQVFKTLADHVEKTHRKVFIAYILFKDINDSQAHADRLAKLIQSVESNAYLFHVNLIKYHPAEGISEFDKPSDQQIQKFTNILEKNHIQFTIRASFGEEIDAACGQLYATYSK